MASAARSQTQCSVFTRAAISVRLSSKPASISAISVCLGFALNWDRNSSSVINRPINASIIRCDKSHRLSNGANACARPEVNGFVLLGECAERMHTLHRSGQVACREPNLRKAPTTMVVVAVRASCKSVSFDLVGRVSGCRYDHSPGAVLCRVAPAP